jgi:hypothetical protein
MLAEVAVACIVLLAVAKGQRCCRVRLGRLLSAAYTPYRDASARVFGSVQRWACETGLSAVPKSHKKSKSVLFCPENVDTLGRAQWELGLKFKYV